MTKAAKKWHARIRFHGERINLGLWDTPEKAYLAYAEASRRLFGEYAKP
jgi:hypothetical protein